LPKAAARLVKEWLWRGRANCAKIDPARKGERLEKIAGLDAD
jgi:hypothetical protein